MSSTAPAGKWIAVTAAEQLQEETALPFTVDGRHYALYRVRGDFYATDGICSHGQARLCDGYLDEFLIECPLHQGCFDIRSGMPVLPPATEAISTYPVRIEAGIVEVLVP
jgi:naphthalene 1,2-dioxygenase system ferredoxin subunit